MDFSGILANLAIVRKHLEDTNAPYGVQVSLLNAMLDIKEVIKEQGSR